MNFYTSRLPTYGTSPAFSFAHSHTAISIGSYGASENAIRSQDDGIQDMSSIGFARFVEIVFIPQHVAHKTFAGRVHYCAILKHVLRPEAVDRLFGHDHSNGNPRLRARQGWPYIDDLPLRDITPAHVSRIILAAFAHGYSAQTVKHIRNVIGTIISHAINENILHGSNPVSSVPLPPTVRKRAQRLDEAQVRSILALTQYPEREITLITMATGMSISEICGLQWKHINLTRTVADCHGFAIPARSILVEQQWNARGLVEIGEARTRFIHIPDALGDSLAILRSQETNSDPHVFVLTSRSGKPISSATARGKVLKTIGRRLKMPWLSWQVIKRTHASLMTELRPQLSHDLILKLGHEDHWTA
jgi:integrase